MARVPIASEVVRCEFQFRNASTQTGLEGVTGEAFQYLAPDATAPVSLTPTALANNPRTGAPEPGWFFADVVTTVEGTYKCMATCVGPSPTVVTRSFVVAPKPF